MIKEKFIFPVVSMLVGIVMLMLLVETLMRAWYFVHNRLEPPFAYQTADLGWRPTADLSFTYERKAYGEIKFSSTRDGFRRFDSLDSKHPRILVIGDSFTQAYHVSDGEAYYDYLAEFNGSQREVFSFAAGGYGTVQQAMALEEYIPLISPDLIVWQFTGNDFINNDHWLESRSPENSSHMRRPFFEENEIVYRHPDGLIGNLAEYSLLMRRLLVIRGSYRKRTTGTIEDDLDMDHPALQRSIATAQEMIQQVAEQNPDTPIISFIAGRPHYHWELPAFNAVCELERLNCSFETSEAVASASAEGMMVDGGRDGHWNGTGHRIAGQVLTRAVETALVNSNSN